MFESIYYRPSELLFSPEQNIPQFLQPLLHLVLVGGDTPKHKLGYPPLNDISLVLVKWNIDVAMG